MRFKASSALLLLVLVSVQAFAADCDVRCAEMAVNNSANRGAPKTRTGMAHCHGMASQPVSDQQTAADFTQSAPCAGHVCTDDWTFVQSAHEVSTSPLAMAELGPGSISINLASSMHDRSTRTIPPLGPLLISISLRV